VGIPHPSSLTEIPAMDAILKGQAEKLANELAAQVTTLEDLNGLMRTMMKAALERMLNTELDVHLQRRGPTETTERPQPTARQPTRPQALPRTAATDIPRRPSAAIWVSSHSRRPVIATAPSSRN
jgi:hypothetical protein